MKLTSHHLSLSSSDEDAEETTNDRFNMKRLSLLPAFPSSHQHGIVVYHHRRHLLLANTPLDRLTEEERRARQRNTFRPSFMITDQRSADNQRPSLFLSLYQQLCVDLARRLQVDDSILDYNYERLFKCIDIMTQERIQYRLESNPITHAEQLPLQKYSVALEFYLQFDVHLFYMKTCLFRGARPNQSSPMGLFCTSEPQARYGIVQCHHRTCQFCFPSTEIQAARGYQSVLRFTSAQRHRFINGYEAILNCPTSCETKNILYALTCPCGQFDYIGYTSTILNRRLHYHRNHANRIIREFILGAENTQQLDHKNKSYEDFVKDGMLLYRHAARCSHALQWFLNLNPEFWPFIPMNSDEAARDNALYVPPPSIPQGPVSTMVTGRHQRSDFDVGTYMTKLSPLPSSQYTFSTRQCVQQFQFLKNEHNRLEPNNNLDLFNATIVTVLPETCSTPLQHIIEALFITHAETKLNTIGHLDGSVEKRTPNPHGMTTETIIVDRGNWCQHLQRPSMTVPSR